MWVLILLGRYNLMNKQLLEQSGLQDISRDRFGTYVPDAHDVIVATYPKSGTNWMMQMVHQITRRGAGEFEHIYDVVPWPDGEVVRAVSLNNPRMVQNAPTGLRAIKTHLGWGGIPYSPDARYVYVIRDPKDVFVSNYFFFKSVALGPIMPPADVWFETYVSDEFWLGSWAEHICSFWQQRQRDNLLIVSFGEMKTDRGGVIQKVASHMGVELSPDEFEAVLHRTSFDYMQSIDHKFNTGAVTSFASGEGRMMRKGKRGDSGEILSLEQQRRVDRYCQEQLVQYGCDDFPYTDFFDLA